MLKNPDYVALGLGHAKGGCVTQHLTPCCAMAAGHTNPLAQIRKTSHNILTGLFQQAPSSALPVYLIILSVPHGEGDAFAVDVN